ncbi:MAG TPA: hypothetical protein VLL97_14370, partial [Acidobacteriota bacterium]|nr:hypothetical protein [Acidobacteriota bacterium]
EACWKALEKDVGKLSGEGDVRLSRDYRFTYFTPFAVAVGVRDFGIEFVDGYYPVALPAELSRTQLNRTLKEIAFQAPFFRQYWVLVPPTEATATKVYDGLAAIGLESVGCAGLKDGALTVTRKATASKTSQQQASIIVEILEFGVPKPIKVSR